MKYEKPTCLSDPGSDFSPEELNRILSKKDAELDWADFDCLFFGKMPAGTYEEVCYYIPTVCALGVLLNLDLTVKCAGGFLIQALPYADNNTISIIEENVSKIRSVSQFLEQRMTPQEISLKVLEKTEPNLLHEQEVKYHCGCGKDRVRKMLLGLGEDELRRMVFEGKPVEVKCHFCEKVHIFYVDELKRMLEFCRQEGKKC